MARIDQAADDERGWVAAARLRGLGQTYGALLALLVLLLYNIAFTPNFLSAQALNVNLTQVAPIVIVATGMTLVIATGGIDLSVGSLMAIAGALAPIIFLSPLPPLAGIGLAFVVPILVAGLFGLFNGVLVTAFRIQPIIATLVLFIAGRGIGQVVTNGNLQAFKNPGFQYIGLGRPLGIPFQVFLMLSIVAIVAWAMRISTFGRYVLATGGNEAAARLAGVPVDRIKLAVYALSGALAGLAGVILAALTFTGLPTAGSGWELSAIAAVVVVGALLTGGMGSVATTLVGVLLLELIFNILNFENGRGLISLSAYWQSVIRGVFLLVVVVLQNRLARRRE